MLGLLASDFGYKNRLTLLQQLIDCGDVLLGRELVYGMLFMLRHDVIRRVQCLYRYSSDNNYRMSNSFLENTMYCNSLSNEGNFSMIYSE